jgi:UDP-glucose 4-epimerase
MSPYACSKLSFEFYLRAQSGMYGFPHAVMRYANVYGPRQDPHGEAGVVAIFMQRMLANEPLSLFARRTQGDDGCIRDYVYVGDVVRANMAALAGDFDGGILNVGTGVETTTRALAEGILATHVAVPVNDGPPRVGDLERSVLDPSDFLKRFHTTTDLATGLRQTFEWFRARHAA